MKATFLDLPRQGDKTLSCSKGNAQRSRAPAARRKEEDRRVERTDRAEKEKKKRRISPRRRGSADHYSAILAKKEEDSLERRKRRALARERAVLFVHLNRQKKKGEGRNWTQPCRREKVDTHIRLIGQVKRENLEPGKPP